MPEHTRLPKMKNKVQVGTMLFGACILATSLSSRAVNVVTAHNDNNRSGANTSETTLTPSNVNQSSFGKLFECTVDGDIYSQPLIVQGVTIGGASHNVAFISTAKNICYAFDADNGALLWQRNDSTNNFPVPAGDVQCCCTDISSWVGVIGTGAIDTAHNAWYFVFKQKFADGSYHQYVHNIKLTDGTNNVAPVDMSATAGGVSFNAKLNNQRAGLLLQGGNVYLAESSHNDCGGYHGWVLGFNATTLAAVGAYPVTDSGGGQGGVWMAGGGLVGDGTYIYFSTGNGTFNANTGGNCFGESYLKLNGTLGRVDWFTPASQQALNNADRDLGGGGCIMVPGTRRILGGGKDGKFYVMNADAMGGYNGSTDACLQSFMVTDPAQSLNHIHGCAVYWNGKVYVGGESDRLKAYSWNGSTFSSTSPATQTSFTGVLNSMPGWQLCATSNGTSNGIIWTTRVFSGNANNAVQPGIIHAFDANNLGTELWNSKQNAGRDDLGNFAKNPAPTVANGKVYCPTFSNKLVVYGLLPGTKYETESLTVFGTSGDNHRLVADAGFSGGNGTILDSNAVNDYVIYTVPNVTAGSYNVKVGIKKIDTRAIWQLAASRADTQTGYTNIGGTVDEYSATASFTEVNLGTWNPATTSDKTFKFTVTGKNASSSNYTMAFDYIKLTRQ